MNIKDLTIAASLGLVMAAGTVILSNTVPQTTAAKAAAVSTDQLIVTYRGEATKANISAIEKSVGARSQKDARSLGSSTRVIKVDNPLAAKNTLSKNKAVKSVELDVIGGPSLTPNDPYFPWAYPTLDRVGGQIDRKFTRAEAAWDVSTGSPDVVIAVVDSGVSQHPDLLPNLLPGYNSVENSTNVNDPFSHGTYVAGMAAARGNNGIGVAGYCWTCKILPVKMNYSEVTGRAYTSDAAEGIRWAADNGADIINVSYGFGSTTALSSAVDYAYSKGAFVVAASGNDGLESKNYPAAYGPSIGVGESIPSFTPSLQPSSNFGDWVDVAAPSGATTAYNASTNEYFYFGVGGTSLAAPAISGSLGLLRSARPELSLSQIESLLCSTSIPITSGNSVRCGVLDAGALLGSIVTPPPTPTPTPTTTSTPTPTPVVDSIAPTKPVLTASVKRSNVVLKWTASTDNVGVKNYSVYRNSVLVYTLPVGTTGVTDKPGPGTASYTVVSSDAAGNKATSNIVTVQVK